MGSRLIQGPRNKLWEGELRIQNYGSAAAGPLVPLAFRAGYRPARQASSDLSQDQDTLCETKRLEDTFLSLKSHGDFGKCFLKHHIFMKTCCLRISKTY